MLSSGCISREVFNEKENEITDTWLSRYDLKIEICLREQSVYRWIPAPALLSIHTIWTSVTKQVSFKSLPPFPQIISLEFLSLCTAIGLV